MAWPEMRIGDIVTSEKICFGEQVDSFYLVKKWYFNC